MKRFLSLSILLALCFIAVAYAQTGYSIQLAAYASPATMRHFEALRQPVQEIKIDANTYLYIIDGFVSYADADKVRKMAVGKGFLDAIALKTSSSRMPALKVKPYTGPKDGDPVPQLAGPAPTGVATSTPPPTTSTPGTYSTTTAPSKPASTTYSSTTPAATTYSSTTPAPTTYSSQTPPQSTPPATATYSSTPPAKTNTPAPTQATPTYSSTTTSSPQPTKPAKPAPKPDPYGNGMTYDYDVNYGSNGDNGTTRGGGDPSYLSNSEKAQNFDITETTVRALVSKGSVTSESVRTTEVTEGTNVGFFDYDKALLRTNTERELARMVSKMQGNVAYVLEIRAHTDAMGTDEYNNELSERRAKSAMIFVLNKGIPASRVNFRAFGETRPLASNTTPDGADNAMGRQINRRVELLLKDFDGRIIDAVTMP